MRGTELCFCACADGVGLLWRPGLLAEPQVSAGLQWPRGRPGHLQSRAEAVLLTASPHVPAPFCPHVRLSLLPPARLLFVPLTHTTSSILMNCPAHSFLCAEKQRFLCTGNRNPFSEHVTAGCLRCPPTCAAA